MNLLVVEWFNVLLKLIRKGWCSKCPNAKDTRFLGASWENIGWTCSIVEGVGGWCYFAGYYSCSCTLMLWWFSH